VTNSIHAALGATMAVEADNRCKVFRDGCKGARHALERVADQCSGEEQKALYDVVGTLLCAEHLGCFLIESSTRKAKS